MSCCSEPYFANYKVAHETNRFRRFRRIVYRIRSSPGEWMGFSKTTLMFSVFGAMLLLISVACGATDSVVSEPPSSTFPASPTSTAAAETLGGTTPLDSTAVAVGAAPSTDSSAAVIVSSAPLQSDITTSTTEENVTAPQIPPLTTPSSATTPNVQRLSPTAIPQPTATPEPARKIGYKVGEQAPDFSFHAVDGRTYTISEVVASGKAVLLYFFASW